MRITPEQRIAIVQSVKEIMGDDARVKLFGSRADDSKRGGDIDLYVRVDGFDRYLQKKTSMILYRIFQKLGELPIDIVIKDDGVAEQLIHMEDEKGILL